MHRFLLKYEGFKQKYIKKTKHSNNLKLYLVIDNAPYLHVSGIINPHNLRKHKCGNF